MREIRTSCSTRGRWVADSIRCPPSYSTGHYYFLGGSRSAQKRKQNGPPMNADEHR